MPSTDLQQAVAEMFSDEVYHLENEVVRALFCTNPEEQVQCVASTGYLFTGISDKLSMLTLDLNEINPLQNQTWPVVCEVLF